jgi:hypothetical protein
MGQVIGEGAAKALKGALAALADGRFGEAKPARHLSA